MNRGSVSVIERKCGIDKEKKGQKEKEKRKQSKLITQNLLNKKSTKKTIYHPFPLWYLY